MGNSTLNHHFNMAETQHNPLTKSKLANIIKGTIRQNRSHPNRQQKQRSEEYDNPLTNHSLTADKPNPRDKDNES